MKARGFNLLELLVAIAISASVISAIFASYGSLFSGYMFNNNKVQLQQTLKLAMTMIKRDLQNAGVFGSFSFHNEPANAYLNGHNIGCAGDWCSFQIMGVGVISYAIGSESIPNPPVSNSTSEVLRVQFGGNKTAYYSGRLNGCVGGNISALNFTRESTVAINAKTYMLGSANRAYLLNFDSTQANNSLTIAPSCLIAVEAIDGDVMTVPDQLTMTLVPLITHYYFIATVNGQRGLYTVTYDGTNVSGRSLISPLVTGLSISYLVDNTATPVINRSPTTNNRYSVCTTAAMNTSGTNCFNRWGQVIAATITLTAQSISGGQTATQTITDTVGWL